MKIKTGGILAIAPLFLAMQGSAQRLPTEQCFDQFNIPRPNADCAAQNDISWVELQELIRRGSRIEGLSTSQDIANYCGQQARHSPGEVQECRLVLSEYLKRQQEDAKQSESERQRLRKLELVKEIRELDKEIMADGEVVSEMLAVLETYVRQRVAHLERYDALRDNLKKLLKAQKSRIADLEQKTLKLLNDK